ncbi:hypothetical protein ES703_35389 [subsurface metagenome]
MMQNILGLAGGMLRPSGLRVPGGEPTQQPFRKHLRIEDGDAVYNTMAQVLAIIGALAAGSVWTKFWEMTVPAQQQIAWGFGSPAFPDNQGYMWFCSMNIAGSFQVGELRLVQAKARETVSKVVAEYDDSRLHGTDVATLAAATPVNKKEMMAVPEKIEFPLIGEDSLLQLWYRCITASAVAEDAVGFSIPVTIYQ